MDRSLTFVIAFATALAAPVSAASFYRYATPATGAPKTAAGIVSGTGTVERGSGFTVQHPEPGVYHIAFDPGYFPTGCAAIVAVSFAYKTSREVITNAYVSGCTTRNPVFHVVLREYQGPFVDDTFQFVAVGV